MADNVITTVRRRSAFHPFAYYDDKGLRRELPPNDMSVRITWMVCLTIVAVVFSVLAAMAGTYAATPMVDHAANTCDNGVASVTYHGDTGTVICLTEAPASK
jgi:hypothetical protein